MSQFGKTNVNRHEQVNMYNPMPLGEQMRENNEIEREQKEIVVDLTSAVGKARGDLQTIVASYTAGPLKDDLDQLLKSLDSIEKEVKAKAKQEAILTSQVAVAADDANRGLCKAYLNQWKIVLSHCAGWVLVLFVFALGGGCLLMALGVL